MVTQQEIQEAIKYIETNFYGKRTRILLQDHADMDWSFNVTVKEVTFDGTELKFTGDNFTGYDAGKGLTNIYYPDNINSPEIVFECGEKTTTLVNAK